RPHILQVHSSPIWIGIKSRIRGKMTAHRKSISFSCDAVQGGSAAPVRYIIEGRQQITWRGAANHTILCPQRSGNQWLLSGYMGSVFKYHGVGIGHRIRFRNRTRWQIYFVADAPDIPATAASVGISPGDSGRTDLDRIIIAVAIN